MNCQTVQQLLEQQHESTHTLPRGVEQHLASCELCRTYQRQNHDLEQALKNAHAVNSISELSPDFHGRFVNALASESVHRPHSAAPRYIAAAIGIAACATVAFQMMKLPQQNPSAAPSAVAVAPPLDFQLPEISSSAEAVFDKIPTPDDVYGRAGRELGALGISFIRATDSATKSLLPDNQG